MSSTLAEDHWERRHGKVLLHPHLGVFTPEGYEWIVAPWVEAVLAWLRGESVVFANAGVADRHRA